MTTSAVILVLAAFLASAVEAVEALTIVLAVGITRGWRSPLIGAGVAVLTLAAVIAALGPALALIPIDLLRLVVGTLLLIFGLQWLRKAILRASGYKALRDEDDQYRLDVELARSGGTTVRAGMDWYAFTLAFKGVFLEGLEVAFIVLTFGTSQGSIPLAALGASVALLLVALVGALVHRPLSRVPENTMKFAVGLMLATFGIFWSSEGAGVAWPGADIAILGILIFLSLVSLGMVFVLRWLHERQVTAMAHASSIWRLNMRWIKSFLLFWYDFIVGDDWLIAAGIFVALVMSILLVRLGIDAWWLMPVAVVILLAVSLWRETYRSP